MLTAIIAGNIGKDAETRAAGSTTVTSFSVASTRKAKGVETTTWIRCSLFGERGEKLAQYLTKGSAVTVVGELENREYTKDGEKKTSLEIRVSDVKLQGGKRDGGSTFKTPADDDGDLPF